VEKGADAFQTLEFNLIEKKNHFDWPDWLPKQSISIDKLLEDYKTELSKLKGKVDLVAGGPPCQGFSNAGRRREDDERNNLVQSYLNFIDLVRPKLIFFENVKGFTQAFKKNKSKGLAYSKMVKERLEGLGYLVKGKIVDFSKYGVPQKRHRFILIGIQKEFAANRAIKANKFFKLLSQNKAAFLKSKKLTQNPTLRDAIGDLLKANGTQKTTDRRGKFLSGTYTRALSYYQKAARAGIISNTVDSHSFANHSQDVSTKFQEIILNQKPNQNLTDILRAKYNVNKNTLILLDANGQAPTITTLPDDYIHYSEPRILTVREYARIQSFPDWFEFKGKYTTGGERRKREVPRYTQIGNAIPPLFGEQAGLALQSLIAQ
jgi:DNA (cytosine-5)-methyltransferase 1